MSKITIKEIGLTGFGKFRNQSVTLEQGINLIQGKNEAGKSTIQAFITGMFYGFFNANAKRRSYTGLQAKYTPWDNGPYRGYLICTSDNRKYRIEREFSKERESVQVFDTSTGEDVTAQFPYNTVSRLHEPGEALLGVSKTTFNSTANIAQLCSAGISAEPGFSGEVNDKLVSMLKSADNGISITAALNRLDMKLEELGTPKKSKTPFGVVAQQMKKLEEELESVRLTEDEGFRLCIQMNRLREQQADLEKKKKLLEAQVQESISKELSGRYLQAKTLKTRMERLKKEAERYQIYEPIDLEQISQVQKKLGAKSQIQHMLSKQERLLEEIEKRLGEMLSLYETLDLESSDYETLEHFDQMYERFSNSLPMQEEIDQLKGKRERLRMVLEKMTEMDCSKLEEDLQEYERLERGKTEEPPKNRYALPLAAVGAIAAVIGLVLAFLRSMNWSVLSIAGIGLCIVGLFLLKGKGNRSEAPSEHAEEIQQEILKQYGAQEKENPREYLEALLGKVQINNYKIAQFKEQEQALSEEISERETRSAQIAWELDQYLKKLTGKEDFKANSLSMKGLLESVKKAKRILLELQKLAAQKQQALQERQGYSAQIEEITSGIAAIIDSCKALKVNSPEDLERCRQGKQKYSEILLELDMQQQMLKQCLEGYQYEELEKAAQEARTPVQESPNREEQQKAQERLKQAEAELNHVNQQIAAAEGRQQVLEKTQRPVGEVEKELEEAKKQAAEMELEVQALELAKKRLSQAGSRVRRNFAPQLNQKVSEVVSYITGGRYQTVLIDPNMKVSLEEKESGKIVEVSSLSSGTIDLIYMAMRFELVSLLCGGSIIPIILDDSFTQLDDTRTEKMLRYLADTQDCQILLFTCHSREKRILDQQKIPYSEIQIERDTLTVT